MSQPGTEKENKTSTYKQHDSNWHCWLAASMHSFLEKINVLDCVG